MKKKLSKILVLVLISTLLINLVVQPKKIYAYTTTPSLACSFQNTSFGLKSDGTLYSWGYNTGGNCGLGTTTNVLTPALISTLSNVKSIIASKSEAFAVLDNGQVYAWGSNASSESGGVGSKKVPTLHPYLSNVNRISTHEYALDGFAFLNDGTIKYWGWNQYGELGNNTTTAVTTPKTFTALTDVKDIAVGMDYVLYLLNNGNVYSSGNYGSQLGIGSNTAIKKTPTLISSISNISRIYAGDDSGFAISNTGTVYVWGSSSNIGLGGSSKSTPTVLSGINGNNVVKIVASSANTYILMNDGTILSTGTNGHGQLGYIQDSPYPYTFSQIPAIDDAIDVACGLNYALILRSDGSVYAMGYNYYGQLGLGYNDTADHFGATIPGLTLVNDTIPPDAPTLSPSITTPTNGNVVVTVNYPSDAVVKQYKIGVADDWINYTSPLLITENASIYARCQDAAGNWSSENSIHINNIDKIAPVITIDPYSTDPTNKDITVTASVDKGTLNTTSHTFTQNGSFDFVATDSAKNVTTKTVEIANIDKDAPSKPIISINENKLTIVSGADGESGVKEILYQLDNGNWMAYSDIVILPDGTYVINAKTVDNAGNESNFDSYNANVYKNAVDNATDALVKAENTYIQSDLDTARALIDALPDSPEKTDLMNRANNLQKIIDDNNPINVATKALVKAENTYNQADLNTAIVLINALPDSPEKTDLINRTNNLQQLIDDNNPIKVTVDASEIFRLQTVNFTIKASDLVDLYTMQLEIHYDPKKLELDQTNIKNLAWENDQNGYAAIKIDSSAGVVNIIYSRKGDTPGVSGNYDLIDLPFRTLQIGKATVEVSKIKLVDSQGKKKMASTTSIKKEINVLPNPLNIILTGGKGQNDWYISPVTVEINDLDAKEIFYTIDGVQYSYTQPFLVNEIGEHNIIVTTDDGNGNMKEKEQVLKIDYNSPTITVNNQTSDWQNEVKVTPKYDDQDGSGISQGWYQWTNTAEQPTQWEEYNQEELLQATEGDWYLHIKAVDKAGNESQAVFGPYHIDKTVPAISIDNDKREAWGSTDVSVTPTFADEGGSQLAYVGYQWSLEQSVPSEYTPYTSGSIQQSDDGAWYLHLVAKDGAGNIQTIAYGPYNIDKSAPIIEFSEVSEGHEYTNKVTPNISIADTLSGVKAQTITLDGQPYVSGTSVTEGGTHTISASAEDYSGNTITKTISFVVVLKPEAVMNMTPSTNLTDTAPITWSYANSIDHSGGTIISAEWQLDTDPVTTSPDGCVAIGTHTMKLRVKNNEDIWSEWSSITFIVGHIYSIYPEAVTQLGTLNFGTVNGLFDGDLDNQVVFNTDDPISGVEFSLLESTTLFGLSGSGSDTGGIYSNGGMDVYRWNIATSTYDYLDKTALCESPNTWYQVFNFTQPGKYKILAAQTNYQGFYEWEFKTAFDNLNTPPVAVISMSPSSTDNTMNITWSYSNSSDADGDSIISAQWQLDSDPVTTNPNGVISASGTHVMKLRVKDRKGTWSEWVSTTFDVSEAQD
jgi:alpha-tubulin suppressor-like RCC1 family protein